MEAIPLNEFDVRSKSQIRYRDQREVVFAKSARVRKTTKQNLAFGDVLEHVTVWDTASLSRAFCPSQLLSQTIHMYETDATTALYYHLLKSGDKTGSEFPRIFELFSTHVLTIKQLGGCDSHDAEFFSARMPSPAGNPPEESATQSSA